MQFGTSDNADDAIDLLLRGQYDGATERYIEMYIWSLKDEDRFIGVDLCTQLLYVVAIKNESSAENVVQEVRALLTARIRDLPIDINLRYLDDDLSSARNAVLEAK